MAEKKIQYSDIAEKDVLDPLKKDFRELNELMSEAAKHLKSIAKENVKLSKQNPLKSYEDAKEAEEGIKRTTEAVKQLDKIEKERVRLQERMKTLEDERIKNNVELRVQIQEQNKKLKEEAKNRLNLVSAYDKESQRLNKMRKEYKDLAIQQKGNTKEGKKLLRNIQDLDKKLKDLDEKLGQSQRFVGQYRRATERLNKTIGKATIAVAAITAVFKLFESVMNSTTETSNGLRKSLAPLTVTVEALTKATARWLSGNKDAFDNLQQQTDEQIKSTQDLIDSETALFNLRIKTSAEIATLRKQQEKLIAASEDDTKSIESQIKARNELAVISNKIFDLEENLAQATIDTAIVRIGATQASQDSLEQYTDALVSQREKEAEIEAFTQNQRIERRRLERDNIELDLDQLIDIADRRKTINEQIAADERNSLEERRRSIDKNNADIEASFNKQTEKLVEGTRVSSDAIKSLISIEDTIELNKRIKLLGLDEIRQNRLREVIQERLQAIQDLKVAQEELNDAERQYRETQSDIILQEETLQELQKKGVKLEDVLATFQEKALQKSIENLEARKILAKEGSQEMLDIEKELNDKLLEQQKNRIEKELAAEKKAEEEKKKLLEKQKELQEAVFSGLRSLQESQNKKRLEAIDKEIEAESKREAELQTLAAQGNETAERNLALAQQRQAELQRQREEQSRRAQRAELAISAFETYGAKVAAGDKNPLASTIADISLLRTFVNSLPAFWEGSEMVGKDLDPIMSGRDGHLIRVDGGERIITTAQNRMIGDMSNMQLAILAQQHRQSIVKPDNSTEALRAEMRKVAQAIENKESYLGMDYDAKQRAITDYVSRKGKLERKHRKNGGIWG